MSSLDLLSLPFDYYQRYGVVAEIATQVRAQLDRPHLKVLDVGGFSRMHSGQIILPLDHFLPQDQVLTVDLVEASLPGYVLASGLSLPFPPRAFDLVVSCDTLEHIPPGSRDAFVDELLRVACHCLVLIAPFDSESNRQAESILHHYLTARGRQLQPLREHLALGLPSADSLRTKLERDGLAAVDFADGYLPHWLTMMLITLTPGQRQAFHADLNCYYNRYYSPGDRREPAHRRVFVIAQPGYEALLPAISSACRAASTPPVAADLGFAKDLIDLLMQIQPSTQEIELRLGALETENAHLRRLVAGYEGGRFIRTMRWFHDQRRRLRKGSHGRE
jgi:hypothetical protein